MTAFKAWLIKSSLGEEPLFRGIKSNGEFYEKLSGKSINNIVKRRLELAGIDNTEFGAHSLRAGFMTEAGRLGYNLKDAMQLSGHTDTSTAIQYYRYAGIFMNPVSELLK